MPPDSKVRRGRFLNTAAGVLTLVLLSALGVTGCDPVHAGSRSLFVAVLSSRPDAVTGGSARIRVTVPDGVPVHDVRVAVQGHDVTGSLAATGAGLEGVVKGLPLGASTVTASAPSATDGTVTVTDHPGTGPLLAGRQETPFRCQTDSFRTVTGVLLGKPLDRNCSITPRTDYIYRTTAQTYRPLPRAAYTDTRRRPADLATTRLPGGRTVPFIVRVDTRTIDRGVAEFAMLDDPATPGTPAWNGKLVYTFGGGCEGGWYVQGTVTGGVTSPRMLSKGYAVASNSLNVFGQNCNDLLATEAFAMTRERFIKDHGLPLYTMGVGCSGGSYQAHQIADNYPGLLDGILVGCSFADVGFDTGQKLFDARLLWDYAQAHPGALTSQQLRKVSGFGSYAAVKSMSDTANRFNPRGNFSPALPAAERYDPVSTPRGARSTVWDHTATVYGRHSSTGFARRPVDNVGVQYGLQSLQTGAITVEQFLDLNAGVGGLDLDLHPTSARTQADGGAVKAAYTTGRLLSGGGGLNDIPIIDYRAYTEGAGSTDLHMRYHTFVTEARLVAANGDAGNEVLLTTGDRSTFDLEKGVLAGAFDAMDQWLTTLEQSGASGHLSVVAAKPADLVDACWTASGVKIAEKQVYQGSTACNRLYPSHAAPRLVAGEPLTADVVVCRLRPVDPAEYRVSLTAAQLARLRAVFPRGVCDYTRPGEWQENPAQTWLFFPSG